MADEVKLFVNGQSQGVRSKKVGAPLQEMETEYHVAWRVVYQPGEVKVVARKDGNKVGEKSIRTAGQPHHLRLTPDRTSLIADGRNLAFVTVEVLDEDNNLCPLADNQVFFTLEGAATIEGVDNGLQTSLERFQDNKRHAFNGKCLVVLKADKQPGSVSLKARAVGLQDAQITLNVER